MMFICPECKHKTAHRYCFKGGHPRKRTLPFKEDPAIFRDIPDPPRYNRYRDLSIFLALALTNTSTPTNPNEE